MGFKGEGGQIALPSYPGYQVPQQGGLTLNSLLLSDCNQSEQLYITLNLAEYSNGFLKIRWQSKISCTISGNFICYSYLVLILR